MDYGRIDKMTLFETLKDRNLLYQTTDEAQLKDMLDNKKIALYCGTSALTQF